MRGWGHGKTKQVLTGGPRAGGSDGPGTRERFDSQWAAICSIAEKIGCTAETLRKWVRQVERDEGLRPGLTTDEKERLKALDQFLRSTKTVSVATTS